MYWLGYKSYSRNKLPVAGLIFVFYVAGFIGFKYFLKK
jgi:hypothetical protein